MKTLSVVVLSALVLAAVPALAKSKTVKVLVHLISEQGTGKAIGSILIKETADGLALTVNLTDLPAGEHGFHVHQNGSCEPEDKDGKKTAGQAAGDHLDPDATKTHKGPGAGGHKGDLPKLNVSDKGAAKTALIAPGLTLLDVAGRSLMIHAGGDNYSDAPKPLGGGGERIACGVVPSAGKSAAKPVK